MNDQKKGSIRFDSTDLVRSVGIWRSPEILNAVIGNIVGLFILSLFVLMFFWVSENVQKVEKVNNYRNQCVLQMMSAGQKVNREYCRLSALLRASKESSK